MHLVNMNCTLWEHIILYIYLCIAVLSRHLHTFRRKSFAFSPLYLAHIILYTCIQYVRTWGSIGLPGCNFFFFTPSLSHFSPQHLTVLMSSRRHRLPNARSSRSAAHGDRRRRNPKRNWFPPDDYPSVARSISIYTYTLYACGYNAIYSVFFSLLRFPFHFLSFRSDLKIGVRDCRRRTN